MKYVLLIYTDQKAVTAPVAAQHTVAPYDAVPQVMQIAGAALYPVTVATTIRVRSGKTQITDGPFAETPDQLSGFYVLDCLDEDVAAQWAAAHSDLSDNMIEIRPALPFT